MKKQTIKPRLVDKSGKFVIITTSNKPKGVSAEDIEKVSIIPTKEPMPFNNIDGKRTSFYMTLDEYLKEIARLSINPLSYGIYLAASGQAPLEGPLKEHLIKCYNNRVSPIQAIEEWI